MIYNRIVALAFSIPTALTFGEWMDSYVAGYFMLDLLIIINILWFAGLGERGKKC